MSPHPQLHKEQVKKQLDVEHVQHSLDIEKNALEQRKKVSKSCRNQEMICMAALYHGVSPFVYQWPVLALLYVVKTHRAFYVCFINIIAWREGFVDLSCAKTPMAPTPPSLIS